MPDLKFFFDSLSQPFGIIGTIFWIWMIIHCWSNVKVQKNRIWWLLLIFFTQWIGAIIYFLTYVLPGSTLGRWLTRQSQSSQWSTPYYQPSRPQPPPPPRQPDAPYVYQPYQSYDQGYQAQAPQYSQYPPVPALVMPTIPQEEQSYSSADYEQPQTMYPEMPQQQ